VPQARQKTTGL